MVSEGTVISEMQHWTTSRFGEELVKKPVPEVCLYRLRSTHSYVGNQLVSYTRRMDLVRIGDQTKLENASLKTKHLTI